MNNHGSANLIHNIIMASSRIDTLSGNVEICRLAKIVGRAANKLIIELGLEENIEVIRERVIDATM
jgi:hypothetical protein